MKISNKLDQILSDKENIITIVYTIIIAFATFGMVINNHVLTHDSVSRLSGMGNDSRISTGRYFIGYIYRYLHNNQIFPVVLFFFTSLFFGLASVYLCKIFDIKSRFYRIIITILIFCFPLAGFYYPYGQDSTAYAIALFLSVLSVKYLIADGWKNHLIVVMLMVGYLGIYQAYVSVAIALFVLYYFIYYILEMNVDYKYFIKRLVVIFIGLVTYYIFLKIILYATGLGLGSYLDADQKSLGVIILSIPSTYMQTFNNFNLYIMCETFFFNTPFNLIWINVVFLLVYVGAFIKKLGLKKGILALLVFSLIFIPAFYAVNFMTATNLSHARYGLLVFPIGATILLSRTNLKQPIEITVIIVLIISCFNNWMQINQELSRMVQLAQTSELIAFDIRQELVQTEDYTVDKPIYFIGSFRGNEHMQLTDKKPYNILDEQKQVFRKYFPGYSFDSGVNSHRKDAGYLMEYMGFEVEYADPSIFNDISSEEFEIIQSAPSYPQQGYIFEIDGVYFIKLGELNDELPTTN